MADFTDSVSGSRNWSADFTGDALVVMWAGGGGGAAGIGLSRGGGGGGGSSMIAFVTPVVLGTSYSYTVGKGGAGGLWASGNGVDGLPSMWGDGSSYFAAPGKGAIAGQGGLGGSTSLSRGDSIVPGDAGVAANAYDGGPGGKAGGSGGGGSGAGGWSSVPAGLAGEGPGAGGGGGYQAGGGNGGAGADGMIYITQAPAVEPGFYLIGQDANGAYDPPGQYEWVAPGTGIAIVENYASGGGARGGAALGSGGSGAGGGGYSLKAVAVTEGVSYTRVVPSGGAGAPYNASTSTDGSDAVFKQGSTVLVLAKAGLRSTGTTSGNGIGGKAANGIGDTKNDGSDGVLGSPVTQLGGAGGAGALPNGGLGGAGGTADSQAGKPGVIPGGGGGGGHATTGGSGGNGASGAVLIRYFLTLGSAVVDGAEKFIVKITHKDASGTVHNIDSPAIIKDGVRVSLRTVRPDLNAGLRIPPSYLPAGTTSLFDLNTGTYNWPVATPNAKAALLSGKLDFIMVGDSVSEGWTYLNNQLPYNSTSDFPNAFPRWARNYLAEALGSPVGGTGMIRPSSSVDTDPQWTISGWSKTGVHYLTSSTVGHVATFSSILPGTAVRVATCGPGVCSVTIDGNAVGDTTPASSGVVSSTVYSGLDDALHLVKISPKMGTCNLMGASVYYPNAGVMVHDLAQGGAYSAFRSGTSSPVQSVWSDTAPGAPASMTASYDQQVGMFGRAQDAVVIMLGGNDSFDGTITPAQIKSAHDIIGQAFDGPNTDIVLMPDVHSEAEMAGLVQLCYDRGWGMIDFFWLSQNLSAIFGQNMNGDTYGHLNLKGAKWAGNFVAQAFLSTMS